MHKLNVSKEFTFKIEPDDHGGRTRTVTLSGKNIAEPPDGRKKRGRKKEPKAHLLIGFDTEYQSLNAQEQTSTVEAGAKNQLLSYQFSIKLITESGSDDSAETEGIIVPTGDERLTMAEFIGFAVGSLSEKFPDLVLPENIYLLGHFIRADFPSFSDFKDHAKLTSNVRSTFVSIDRYIPVEFTVAEEKIAEFRVCVRDTILLAPANAKSLADLGALMGFPKIKLGDTPEQDRKVKENMAAYRREHWPAFREYAIRDAQVCVRFAERIIRQSQTLFKSFKMPATLTSFGTKLLLQQWKEIDLDRDAVLGQETVKEKYFDKRRGHFVVRTVTPLMEEAHYNEAFITETYHGGRNEQFIFGIADEGMWRDHDLSSAYTTAMSLIGLPNWEEIRHQTEIDDIHPLELAYFSVDFEFPQEVRFPTLPVRTGNGIIFPRKGNAKCAAPELVLAMKLGAILEVRKGVRVKSERDKPIFKDFIRTCIENRGKHKKGTFDNFFWKEVGNSTYGKTAQGLRQKRVYNLHNDDMEVLPPSKITQPYFASFITSFTRAVLGEILNGFSDRVQVFSVTTDGFLANANDLEIQKATMGELFAAFSDARRQLDNSSPLEVKHTVRQPLGWRTRGSATLKPGEGGDGIVLQKGGIKTNELLDVHDENRVTVDLFLNRTPEQKIPYKTGAGIKDMMRNDTDFVFRSVTKRLSMEFDWKRRPVNVRDVDVEFDGKRYTHLTFDSVPIEDHQTFSQIRDAWETYDKNARHNLKLVADLKAFEAFRTSKGSLTAKASKYIPKQDGAMKRLRRDLTRAYQQEQAGFQIIRSKRNMTHADFKNSLLSCGIPCKISDIDNGKKGVFTPGQSPDTDEVINALRRLKRDHYPELEIELFVPEDAMK
jgi:hypothetical protein